MTSFIAYFWLTFFHCCCCCFCFSSFHSISYSLCAIVYCGEKFNFVVASFFPLLCCFIFVEKCRACFMNYGCLLLLYLGLWFDNSNNDRNGFMSFRIRNVSGAIQLFVVLLNFSFFSPKKYESPIHFLVWCGIRG